MNCSHIHYFPYLLGTEEPRFNEPLFNEVLDITNRPGQSYSKMYGIEPQYNEPQYNKFFDIAKYTIREPKRKVYPEITENLPVAIFWGPNNKSQSRLVAVVI